MEMDKKIAVLIDGDNIPFKYAEIIFNELNKNYGECIYRRIYGDWSKNSGWTPDQLIQHGITPIHQISYTTGKNSTDITMVIDAMDILYQDKINAFCIVSSDSDFTRLILRLRESDKFVIGMGESKTPKSILSACNKFVYLDLNHTENDFEDNTTFSEDIKNPIKDYQISELTNTQANNNSNNSQVINKPNIPSLDVVNDVIVDFVSDKNSVNLGELGSYLSRTFSNFDSKLYGYSKLKSLVEDNKKIKLIMSGSTIYLAIDNTISAEKLESEIINLINANNGVIKNLSIIHKMFIEEYGSNYLKLVGYSKISKFVQSLKSVQIIKNTLVLKK